MKQLSLLIIFFFLCQNAFSASFTKVEKLGDERLMRLSEIHYNLSYLHHNCGTRGFLQIAARRLSEKWENTVKQAVYFTNTGVNAPVSGVKAQSLDLKDEVAMRQFVAMAFSDSAYDENEVSREDKIQINAFKSILLSLHGDYQFYAGDHENNLGPASYAVVVDLVNAEILVLEANHCR
ncbi:MAG: hypothetical protein K2P81_05960 [Bacteriovoracaceae bacterium]|nr:hypothetical protein [Bacteriovoracaceae bacterium]